MNTLLYSNYRNITNQVYFRSQNSCPSFVTKVDENVYRGRKPERSELKQLKDMGINTIVDFSSYDNRYNEKECAEQCGMKYIALPFDLYPGPNNEQIKTFFDTTQGAKENGEKVYVHCTYGRDRTGFMINMYKLHNGLSIDDLPFIERMMASRTYEKYCEMKNEE